VWTNSARPRWKGDALRRTHALRGTVKGIKGFFHE
jgi:hypothetical protein